MLLQPQIIRSFEQISQIIFVPTTEEEYDRILGVLDEVTDIVRDDENHPLTNLMDVLGVLVETYEDQHIPEPEGTPLGCLEYLMQEHGLKQGDLAELGSPAVISEILSGRRALDEDQSKALSKRFGCSPEVFQLVTPPERGTTNRTGEHHDHPQNTHRNGRIHDLGEHS